MVGYLQDKSDINKDETAGNNEKKPQTPEEELVKLRAEKNHIRFSLLLYLF